jgi:hypothetical protein
MGLSHWIAIYSLLPACCLGVCSFLRTQPVFVYLLRKHVRLIDKCLYRVFHGSKSTCTMQAATVAENLPKLMHAAGCRRVPPPVDGHTSMRVTTVPG